MSRGHNFTRCQFCNLEYVCGDCITNECQNGKSGRKSCEHFQAYVRNQKSLAEQMERIAQTRTGKPRAIAILLGDTHWEKFAETLSHAELSEELKIKVWANQKIGTYEIALVVQAIERLKECASAQQREQQWRELFLSVTRRRCARCDTEWSEEECTLGALRLSGRCVCGWDFSETLKQKETEG